MTLAGAGAAGGTGVDGVVTCGAAAARTGGTAKAAALSGKLIDWLLLSLTAGLAWLGAVATEGGTANGTARSGADAALSRAAGAALGVWRGCSAWGAAGAPILRAMAAAGVIAGGADLTIRSRGSGVCGAN